DEEKAPKSDVDFFLAVFLGWFAISLVMGVYRHDAILETARVGGVLCWYFLAREWFKKLPPEKFVSSVLLLIGCISVGGLVVVIPALMNFFQTHNPRQFGTFYNPNLLANFCAIAVPLTVGGALYAKQLSGKFTVAGKVLSFLLGVAALLTFGGLIVTSSKGGMLALLLAAVVFVVAMMHARGKEITNSLLQRKVLLVPILIIILIGGGVLLSQTLLPRIQTSLHDDHSSMFRWFAWIATVKMAMAKPLFGWGPGSFPSIFPMFAIAGYTRSAHESWLQIAAENGWPAMIILLIACGAAWRGGWQALRSSRYPLAAGALAAITAFVVHGLVDSGWGIISVGWILMLVMGLLATVEVKEENAPPAGKAVSLNWPWLAAALVMGGLSFVTQNVSHSEDLRAQSQREIQTDPKAALQTAQDAINGDPANIRLWENKARIQWSLGEDANEAYQKELLLNPYRSISYFNYARYLQYTAPVKNEKQISDLYDKAVFYSRNDTTVLLARAKWEIKNSNKSGWDDLKYILELQHEPYGEYPAVPEMVNFDYGQAALLLARHALDQGDATSAKSLLDTASQELKKGEDYINSPYQQQILDAAGQTNTEDRDLLASMKADYQELNKRLQHMKKVTE
ncbi:MAG: O-antigen ligase family protein, partial [Abditibacteriaceae bacterium]